jgi:hypothetical protein
VDPEEAIAQFERLATDKDAVLVCDKPHEWQMAERYLKARYKHLFVAHVSAGKKFIVGAQSNTRRTYDLYLRLYQYAEESL